MLASTLGGIAFGRYRWRPSVLNVSILVIAASEASGRRGLFFLGNFMVTQYSVRLTHRTLGAECRAGGLC